MNDKKRKTLKQYFNFLCIYGLRKKLLIFYVVIIIFIILNALISLVRPKLQGNIIDDLSTPSNIERTDFMILLMAFLVMIIFNYLILYVQKYLMTVVAEEIAADVRQKLHDKIATVKVDFFEEIDISNILVKIDKDVEAIKQCGITSILSLISNVVILVVVPPYMFFIHKGIAISNFLLLVSIPCICKVLGGLIQETTENVLYGYSSSTSVLTNNYSNWFIMRIFQCYDYIHSKYEKENQKYKHAKNEQNFLYIVNTFIILLIQFIGTVIIWIVGANEIFKGNMTVGTIMALMSYQTIIMNPIIGISDFANEYHTAVVSLKDINLLIEYPDTKDEEKDRVLEIPCLSFENVCFHYPGVEDMIFENLNISFQKGKIYAVQGKSGQGKSTLFKLISGIIQPVKGHILIGNKKLIDSDLNDYWTHIGFVMQRSQFFKDSIVRNIGFDRKISEQELDILSDQLDLYEEIHKLVEGWDTEIKTETCNLSEGQMRRLDIMRNVLKEPEILIFDEVTANIDEERRKKFFTLLHELSNNKIIIYSTHNPSELTEADIVIDLSEI